MSFHSDNRRSVDITDYLCYRGMPVQIRNSRHWSRTWPCDVEGNLILISLPENLDLSDPTEPKKDIDHVKTNITSLPRELHWAIFDHLIPVDRVCLGLTCKTLASSLVSSSPLSSAWPRFVDCGYNFFIPESYHLIQRLAHGWVNKKDFRYCWKCRKILPRDFVFFKKRLEGKKLPKWNVKVGMAKDKWQSLSKKKRYAHLIDLWCEADWEDSSCYSCNECRPHYVEACRDRILKFADQAVPLGSYQPTMHQATQCPCCLEEELTWHLRQPRKKVFRPLLWKILNILWSIVSSIVLIILYLIIIIVEAPWKYGKKGWKKWRLGDRLRRLRWWKR